MATVRQGNPLRRDKTPLPLSRKRRVGASPTDNPEPPFDGRVETPNDPLRIVTLGGGTGLSTVLHGLKRFAAGWAEPGGQGPLVDLAAVVTVSDDGGSSGKLRRTFDILAPGDIRNCLVALAEDEALLSRLFQYRFGMGKGLEGHSFGNLFLTALTEVTGDFHQAIQLSSEVLAIRGRIFPSTLENVSLEAQLESGRSVRGETRISSAQARIRRVQLEPRHCPPLAETLTAIGEADLITLGPGSLYTSVVPNLLVDGIPEAIAASKALKVYISNLMWQPGETDGYTASDHLRALLEHARLPIVDCIVLNSGKIPSSIKKRYQKEHAWPVEDDHTALEEMGVDVLLEDLLAADTVVRHDSALLANLLVRLARKSRLRRAESPVRGPQAVKGSRTVQAGS